MVEQEHHVRPSLSSAFRNLSVHNISLLSHTVLRRIDSRCILTKINYHSDVDECRSSSHNNCSINAICNNTKGSYNCSCKPGYSGNGHNCSSGCLRSFIEYYLLRLTNPCRVTVTAHTELLGPVTVPSLMRNRPPHSTWVVHRPKEFICARIVRWGLRFIVLIREH